VIETDGNTLFLFTPGNDRARSWLQEHTDGEWFAGKLVVEHRYALTLAQGLLEAGFEVK